MIHLDGMRETHNFVCNRQGVFDKAIEMIQKGKELGYYIYLNTTVYKETQTEEVKALCQLYAQGVAPGVYCPMTSRLGPQFTTIFGNGVKSKCGNSSTKSCGKKSVQATCGCGVPVPDRAIHLEGSEDRPRSPRQGQ